MLARVNAGRDRIAGQSGKTSLALEPLSGLVVIDGVQRRPGLFPILRVLADRRRQPARFLILGSASGDLLLHRGDRLLGVGTRTADIPVNVKFYEQGPVNWITNQDQSLHQAGGQVFYNVSRFTLRDLRTRASQQQPRADVEACLDGFSPSEHWTPRGVVKLMAKLLFLPIADEIESGTCRSGTCRSGARSPDQAFKATSTSSSIFFASPNSIRLFSL